MPHRLRVSDDHASTGPIVPSNAISTLSINTGEQTYLERHETTRVRINGVALLVRSWFRLDFDRIGIEHRPMSAAISDSGQSVHVFEAELA